MGLEQGIAAIKNDFSNYVCILTRLTSLYFVSWPGIIVYVFFFCYLFLLFFLICCINEFLLVLVQLNYFLGWSFPFPLNNCCIFLFFVFFSFISVVTEDNRLFAFPFLYLLYTGVEVQKKEKEVCLPIMKSSSKSIKYFDNS